ncbi:MAG: 1-(5-phosphoribosyl)-5-[(5-phosphoribosylamino)methylideneamino]imidazole-4-carboxamide isomerase [Elusimicrobiota bacterium]|nr:1-(5-phosphoribosyl)-5-[(5-phosphoribosylamino)methylideneamino]imidazole-4-carboxamide isomerase [Elusimicrobiota bacterium]
MLVIPAIDIRGGNCVRLIQGKLEQETIFSKDPVFVAKLWQAQGAKKLHIVDLDGAFAGVIQNLELIAKIAKSIKIPVEVGGGIRDMDTIKAVLSGGVAEVILGTSAIYDTDTVKKALKKFRDKIVISIDSMGGKVAIGGWKEITAVRSATLAKRVAEMGVKKIIFTDIKKDGMLKGPNVKRIKAFAEKVRVPVIACGGISTLDDVKNIKELEEYGVSGMIIGKALYTGGIKLQEAIEIAEE